MERVCESCGDLDEELVAVAPRGQIEPDLELWCPACRTERDHESADGI